MWIDLFIINIFIMLFCWVIVTYNKRAGLVDAIWSLSIALNVILAALWTDTAPLMIRIFLAVASGLWFLRLGGYLLKRYLTEHEEDTRYANMRRAMGRYQHFGFLLFFIFQAGLVILFSYPMLHLLSIPASEWNEWTLTAVMIALVLMFGALIGETAADRQLYRFKLNPLHQGKTLDQGLWKYSRHPNYFFEWLHWFAYPIVGLVAGAYVLWIYPVLMWLFLYYITGIPFNEQRALAHRGDHYRDYQRRTSMFIPWIPKK